MTALVIASPASSRTAGGDVERFLLGLAIRPRVVHEEYLALARALGTRDKRGFRRFGEVELRAAGFRLAHSRKITEQARLGELAEAVAEQLGVAHPDQLGRLTADRLPHGLAQLDPAVKRVLFAARPDLRKAAADVGQ